MMKVKRDEQHSRAAKTSVARRKASPSIGHFVFVLVVAGKSSEVKLTHCIEVRTKATHIDLQEIVEKLVGAQLHEERNQSRNEILLLRARRL